MARVWQRDYANHAAAMTDIADYIVGFYNSVRLHSSPGYPPPIAYERKHAQPQSQCTNLVERYNQRSPWVSAK